jgi:hypothetical protein
MQRDEPAHREPHHHDARAAIEERIEGALAILVPVVPGDAAQVLRAGAVPP